MNTIVNPLALEHPLPAKSLVLVGMPGAGKSSIGRRLAARLALPFADSDAEIRNAAGMPVDQIFERYGETEYRAGERRVVQRLLEESPRVISTGGGTFCDPVSHELIQTLSLSIWLRVDEAVLIKRVSRRQTRPMLKGSIEDQKKALSRMLVERTPFYAKAVIAVDGDDRPADETVERVLKALGAYAHNSECAQGKSGQSA